MNSALSASVCCCVSLSYGFDVFWPPACFLLFIPNYYNCYILYLFFLKFYLHCHWTFAPKLKVFILNSIPKCFFTSTAISLMEHTVSTTNPDFCFTYVVTDVSNFFFHDRKKNRIMRSTWTWIMCLSIKFRKSKSFSLKTVDTIMASSALWYYRRENWGQLDFL